MALTNAERQAAFKARKSETIDALAQQNAALLAEVVELRAELDAMRSKAHKLEISSLKAQIAATKAAAEQQPKSSNAQGNASAAGRVQPRKTPPKAKDGSAKS